MNKGTRRGKREERQTGEDEESGRRIRQEEKMGKEVGGGKGILWDAGRDKKFVDMKEETMINRHRETVVSWSHTNSVSLVFPAQCLIITYTFD